MFGRFRKDKDVLGRICPLCELENPVDASSCSQCYFQLEKNNRQQDEAISDVEENVLLDELLNGEMEVEEEEATPVDVITMDEMTVEIDQYQVVDSDGEAAKEFTFIKSTGPTFSEIEVAGDGPIESQSTPSLASLPGVEVEQNVDYVSEVAEEIEVDESEAEVDLLSLPELPQVIASPPIERDDTDYVTSVGDVVAEATVGLPILPDVVAKGDGEVGNDLVSVPLPEPVTEVALELPPLPDVTPAPPASIPPTTAPPTTAFGNSQNGHFWPWSVSEAWDYRDLYRELKEAMEAGRRGDHITAATSLDRLGPHLGERVDLLYYVGQVLIILGRREELNSMLLSAQRAHPDDQQVSTAVYHLGVMGQNDAVNS
ncbi:MAG TPA: hypothetical protein EYN88_04245 [Candidatus Poseidoniales archaeon]|nr:hypothetical protein [Candidatus Poseidoniales archaeon]